MEDTMEGLEGGGGPMEEIEEDLVGGGPGLTGMLFPHELEDGSSILFRSKLICDQNLDTKISLRDFGNIVGFYNDMHHMYIRKYMFHMSKIMKHKEFFHL